MRLKTNEDKINLPIKVVEAIRKGEETGISGINLLSGQPVNVFLTTKGKSAENADRPTIESLFVGKETESGLLQLKPGGIASMNGAFKKRNGDYIAQWPYVVRYDGQDTVLLCQDGVLIPTEREDGSTCADFYSFHPEQSIKASQADDELKQAVAVNAEQTMRPAYLIRVIDDGRVLDYELHLGVYDNDTQKPLTADQIADRVTRTAGQLLEKHPGKELDILPASRFFIPAQNYEKRSKFFNSLDRYFVKDSDDADREYCCRRALIKCGGDEDQYCNQINVIEPYKPGADPVLLGGYRYTAEEMNHEPEQQTVCCRP
jgi:hypothetical protein